MGTILRIVSPGLLPDSIIRICGRLLCRVLWWSCEVWERNSGWELLLWNLDSGKEKVNWFIHTKQTRIRVFLVCFAFYHRKVLSYHIYKTDTNSRIIHLSWINEILYNTIISEKYRIEGEDKMKKLLLTTSLSIAEVSEKSGYADYRVFTKVFKKSGGITPSQYRRDFMRWGTEKMASFAMCGYAAPFDWQVI